MSKTKTTRVLENHPILRPTFAFAYRNFALPLTKFLVKRLHGDQEVVDEIFSQTIEAAWKGHTTFQSKSNYYTWLCRIALNKIADYYRRKINKGSFVIAPFLDAIARVESINPTPEEKLALKELKGALISCLNLLPKESKEVLLLRFWKDMTIKEIASALGTTPRSVEGKIYRSRKLFQKHFQERYPSLAPAPDHHHS